ncbi:PHD finger protein PERSISTENT TAPETAL CELL 1 [Macadamia integrifolia]|uniref:PHD finger protein PERSISTENT TAPETAL CELL 1 n=1 Tax=Macadamia integrifolia TaxID=60698 RepID=UPI001C4F146F|nr:PHD finger protein PERSISTENT TAPETAL CELL 1 [Macadamia integrifolia]
MTQLNLSSCKKRKRGGRAFGFKTFCEAGYPVEFNGLFHQNIKTLLELGSPETNLCSGMQSWSFQLELHRHPLVHISLLIIEEPIEASARPHCNHCLYVGWGHHMICNKKFHFVVPSKEIATSQPTSLSHGGNCRGSDATTTMKSNLIEQHSHLMHGVLHMNGFGHLLCINGVEKGSELAGHEIMDLWDRICTGLRVRKVSLTDVARKRNMDLRLIHGVAYGEPWFSRWGYRFGHGSFGVTQLMYQKAIEAIQGMPLCLLVHHLGSSNHEIPVILHRYQMMSSSSLLTLGHLFHFMLQLKSHLPQEKNKASDNSSIVFDTASRWSPKRVEMAAQVIVDALRKAENRWVSRQEVRDAARVYIGDTGLLDFVLKSLGNHIVGNYIVRRSVNPVTKVLEYCLEDISCSLPNQANLSQINQCGQLKRLQLMKDIFYLYKYILNEQRPAALVTRMFTAIPVAARIILDTKHLIKDYGGELCPNTGHGENLMVLCTICLNDKVETNEGMMKALPPHEVIVLPAYGTVEELKKEVQRVFKEMYWGLRSFVVELIIGLNAKDSDLILKIVQGQSQFVVKGRILDKGINIDGIYEGSIDNHVMDCPCGAKEDDGERMISCDICEVWQHTRCVRIGNNEDVPHIFLCSRCEHDISLLPSLP